MISLLNWLAIEPAVVDGGDIWKFSIRAERMDVAGQISIWKQITTLHTTQHQVQLDLI